MAVPVDSAFTALGVGARERSRASPGPAPSMLAVVPPGGLC